MIEGDVYAPAFGLMTLLAIDAEFSAVYVSRAMTAVASDAQLLFADDGAVASMAIRFVVFAEQRKLGIAIVIELTRLPSARIVTLAALRA